MTFPLFLINIISWVLFCVLSCMVWAIYIILCPHWYGRGYYHYFAQWFGCGTLFCVYCTVYNFAVVWSGLLNIILCAQWYGRGSDTVLGETGDQAELFFLGDLS